MLHGGKAVLTEQETVAAGTHGCHHQRLDQCEGGPFQSISLLGEGTQQRLPGWCRTIQQQVDRTLPECHHAAEEHQRDNSGDSVRPSGCYQVCSLQGVVVCNFHYQSDFC
jgi:hypothetical protein